MLSKKLGLEPRSLKKRDACPRREVIEPAVENPVLRIYGSIAIDLRELSTYTRPDSKGKDRASKNVFWGLLCLPSQVSSIRSLRANQTGPFRDQKAVNGERGVAVGRSIELRIWTKGDPEPLPQRETSPS